MAVSGRRWVLVGLVAVLSIALVVGSIGVSAGIFPGASPSARGLGWLRDSAAVRASSKASVNSSVTSGPITLSVATRVFYPNADGTRDTISATVTLAQAGTLSVSIVDFDGRAVRKLAVDLAAQAGSASYAWDGTKKSGKVMPEGPYRFRVSEATAAGTSVAEAWIAKAKQSPYAVDPSDVVIVLDAGHGKPDSGAVFGGIREADMNLDIAERLQQLLQSAGITVVMTRIDDRETNRPRTDLNGDGKVNHSDDLIKRNDIANLARADAHVVLMNNAYGCHCAHGTETYTSVNRTWTPEGVNLGRFIQGAHMQRLKPFATRTWQPKDRGVRPWKFAAIRPYSDVMPRPGLMPGVLVESLFMDQPNELAKLTRPAVRTALAMAYYDGIAKWLNTRTYGLRYVVTSSTPTLEAGQPASYALHVTNTGNTASSGWVLEARMVTAPSGPYDGSPVRGTLVAETPIPDGIGAGQSVDLAVTNVPTPAEGGNWLMKFDVRLPGADTLQDHGVVGPQVPLTTTVIEPPPTPSPEPTETPSATEAPGASETPGTTETPSATEPAGASETLEPTEAPTASEGPATEHPVATESPAASETRGDPSETAVGSGLGSAPIVLSRAVAPRLFRVYLPQDPVLGRVGAAGNKEWPGFQVWRRYLTPLDIPPDSVRGQHGLDEHEH